VLYRPRQEQGLAEPQGFLARVHQHLRQHFLGPGGGDSSLDVSLATAAVAVSETARPALLPCGQWRPPSAWSEAAEGSKALELITDPSRVQRGDFLVAHPYLTDEGLGGCLGVVLRHSPLDSLCLLLNVDGGIDGAGSGVGAGASGRHTAGPQSQRPSWRLHVHLPPLAPQDPRNVLPAVLGSIPLRWGGPHPVPLHLLHSVPLVPPPARQTEAFQRITGHEVCPGLWCSFLDARVLSAVERALRRGEASPQHFGAFVGMLCLQPGRLGAYMAQNHWFILRASAPERWPIPPQGWGSTAWGVDQQWADDRCWGPWRALLRALGGEFADWASVGWVGAGPTPRRAGQSEPRADRVAWQTTSAASLGELP